MTLLQKRRVGRSIALTPHHDEHTQTYRVAVVLNAAIA